MHFNRTLLHPLTKAHLVTHQFHIFTHTSVLPSPFQVALHVMASISILGEVSFVSAFSWGATIAYRELCPASQHQHLIFVFSRSRHPICIAPYQPTYGDIYTRLLLPGAQICIVIGRGGEAIRGICDVTGAHVNIASPGANHRDPTHRLVRPSV